MVILHLLYYVWYLRYMFPDGPEPPPAPQFEGKINHISKITAKINLITKIFYCMKAHSVRDHPKINHIAEKTIYPETHISGTQCSIK